jgi:hypothetical protein
MSGKIGYHPLNGSRYAEIVITWLKISSFVVLLGAIVIALSLLLLWDMIMVNLTRSGSVQAPMMSNQR